MHTLLMESMLTVEGGWRALHRPRVRARFEREGLTVIPVPPDFEAAGMPLEWADFLPTATTPASQAGPGTAGDLRQQ